MKYILSLLFVMCFVCCENREVPTRVKINNHVEIIQLDSMYNAGDTVYIVYRRFKERGIVLK